MVDNEPNTSVSSNIGLFTTPDIPKIISNVKYISLWERHSERNDRLNQAYELPPDQRIPLIRQIFEEEDNDSAATLTIKSEVQEYENWFQKFKSIEVVKSSLDPGIYPILYQFNCLPFISHQSDTGHVIAETNTLKYYYPIPILTFALPENSTDNEKIIQKKFFDNFDDLCILICDQLNCRPYNILDLTGFNNNGENTDDSPVDSENYMNFDDINIKLFVPFPELKQQKGREVLVSVWQNFHSYINSFLKDKLPPLNLGNGDIFIDKK